MKCEYYRYSKTDRDIPGLVKMDPGPDYVSMGYCANPQEILMLFEFGDPIPKLPVMSDFFYAAACGIIVSPKIHSVLAPMHIPRLQFIPSIIRDHKEEQHNYWALCINPNYECIDHSGRKAVFKHEILEPVPLQERLVFRNGRGQRYFHKSLVEEIMKVKPTGFKFVNPINEKDFYCFVEQAEAEPILSKLKKQKLKDLFMQLNEDDELLLLMKYHDKMSLEEIMEVCRTRKNITEERIQRAEIKVLSLL